MKLTQASRSQSDDSFPTTQLFFLAICRLAEPIAVTSIFPYAWRMVQDFHVGERNDASFYAGILISAFALAEATTGMFWGGLSDRIGRKPVLLLGCFGTMISLLMVGFSSNFAFALLGRVAGGMLNGNIGVIQTMVGELVKKPEHEPKAYAVMPFIWSIGCIVGPAIGGTFATPVDGFPQYFEKGGFFDNYPYALPNLICAVFMVLSITAGYLWLEETHPDLRKGADPDVIHDIAERTPMITAAGAGADPGVDLRQESYGTFNEVDVQQTEQWQVTESGNSPMALVSEKEEKKWFSYRIAMLMIALGLYAYHSMCYDHLLPIFLQDDRIDEISVLASGSLFHVEGGLGLTTKSVGLIMAVNGVIALIIQAVVFPVVAERLGIFKTFMLVTILAPTAFFIVPYLALLPDNLIFPGIYFCLTIRNLLSILAYPVLLIMLKQASPSPSYLGKINGLAASVGAACRTIAPPIAGLLYGWGADIGFSGLAWYGAGIVAMIGVFQLFFVPTPKTNNAVIKSLAPCLNTASADEMKKEVVHVTVVEVDSDSDIEAQT